MGGECVDAGVYDDVDGEGSDDLDVVVREAHAVHQTGQMCAKDLGDVILNSCRNILVKYFK